MRIAVIGPTYPFRGGIAHHTTFLVKHLRHSGHEVLFISFSRQYPKWLYGRDDKDPSQHPAKTDAHYLIDSLNPITWHQAAKTVANFRPERVIIPWWVPFWAPAWRMIGQEIKWRYPTTKLIFILHNVLPHEPSWFDRLAVRIGIGLGDGYLAQSQQEAQSLKEIFPAADLVTTPLPTYASLGETKGILPVSLPDDRPILLFCGLVRHYKGLDVLLAALPHVLAAQAVHLAIVGEFWEDEATYRQQIADLGLESAVTIVNRYVADEVLTAFLEKATAVVLPYRSATQSAVVQLALGHGVPVITTAVGGLAEVIADGKNGLVVEPEQPRALATAVNHYLQNGLDEDNTLATNNTEHSWARFSQHLLSL